MRCTKNSSTCSTAAGKFQFYFFLRSSDGVKPGSAQLRLEPTYFIIALKYFFGLNGLAIFRMLRLNF
jgi:hypothetical protein